MSQSNETFKLWFDHWKNHKFASSIGPLTWDELMKKFGYSMIVRGFFLNLIDVIKDSNNERITEFPPKDKATLYRIHFEGETMAAMDLTILGLNDEDLAAVRKKYPKDPFSCDEECEDGTKTLEANRLKQYKIWFKRWSDVHFADDLFDEQTMEELAEEYGMENMVYALIQGWLNFYYGGGVLDDIAGFESPEDETGIVEMHFDAKNMAKASKMLKDDPTYTADLESVNDLYGTAAPKRKREDDSDFFTKKHKIDKGDEIVATAAEKN